MRAKLQDKCEAEKMRVRLAKVGGVDTKDWVKNILRRAATNNNFLAHFNLNGGGELKKLSFTATKVFEIMKEVVLAAPIANATEKSIKDVTQTVLKYAPDRTGSGDRHTKRVRKE